MEKCKNGVCGVINECLLQDYLDERSTVTLDDRAEAAETMETLGPKCLIADQLRTQYAGVLEDSTIALEQLRERNNTNKPNF